MSYREAESLNRLRLARHTVRRSRCAFNPEGFGGFALDGLIVPLDFVNGSDIGAARIFRLYEEIDRIRLSRTALSYASMTAHGVIDE